MKFEPEDIERFRQIWKGSFQEEISYEEALEKSTQLLEMMKLVYQPLPKPSSDEQLSILFPNQTCQ